MTIQEIAERNLESSEPYFFSKDTLACFGQTLESFSVEKCGAYYRISAPSYWGRKLMGTTVRYFDPESGELITGKHANI